MSTLKVPGELMEDATGHLANPLNDETVQAEIGKFLDDFLTTQPILPQDAYEKRQHLTCIVEAIQYAIGVR